jgi:alpha-D-ribose 1-methylphosphonate 5-triphosphate synthase subunit PhnH
MNQQTRIPALDLTPGFDDPQRDAQRVFRQILEAMSHPGQIVQLDRMPEAPPSLSKAAAAIALTLFDLDTPVWLSPELRQAIGPYIAFHTGAALTHAVASAGFLMVANGRALPDLAEVAIGDPEYPERAATIIIQVQSLQLAPGCRLRGPGILGHIDVCVEGLAEEFWTAFAANHRKFPLGFDVLLVAGEQVLGLPRSVAIDGKED